MFKASNYLFSSLYIDLKNLVKRLRLVSSGVSSFMLNSKLRDLIYEMQSLYMNL